MRLRYTGAVSTVFVTGNVGQVEPGQEFEVSDDLAGQFRDHPDIEVVEDAPSDPPADTPDTADTAAAEPSADAEAEQPAKTGKPARTTRSTTSARVAE